MKTFKQYIISESELRKTINEANHDLLSDTLDVDVLLQQIAKNPKCLQHKLIDVLMDCQAYLFDSSMDFRDLTTLFLENWSCFSLCTELVRDYERDPSLDFEVIIQEDQADNRVVFNKAQLLRNY